MFYRVSILARSVHSVPEKCCGVEVQGLYLTLLLTCTANTHRLLHLAVCHLHHLLNKDSNRQLPLTCFVTSCGTVVCEMVTKDLVAQTINNDIFLNLNFILISSEDFLCFSNHRVCCSSLLGPFLFFSDRSHTWKAVLSGTQYFV